MLHAARWKCRTQKSPKIRHLGTIAQLCQATSSQLRHVSTIGKKLVKQQYLLYMSMVNFGPLAAEIVSLVRGAPANFNKFRVLASLLHRRRSTEATKLCTMFGRLLGWYAIYTFSGAVAPNGILPGAKFSLRSSLAFSYIGSVTTRHSSSGC